jgi:hypothetical protein
MTFLFNFAFPPTAQLLQLFCPPTPLKGGKIPREEECFGIEKGQRSKKLGIHKPLNLHRRRFLKRNRLKNNFLDLTEFIYL